MQSDDLPPGIDRRALISNLMLLPALPTTLLSSPVQAQTTPNASLASWNEGPAKQAIVDFVRATTDPGSSKFVPADERIATFDQDGTLWVEHPIYTQVTYCLDRVSTLATQKPELKMTEPFKTVLSGDREAMARLSMHDLETILVATLTGMPVEEFEADVNKWLQTARHPRWKRLYTDLTYQPMLDVLRYLRDNGFKCASIRSGSTASLPSRWSAPWAARSSATTRTASRS